MEQQKYYDKHGKEIKAGMWIKHDDGDKDKVYKANDGDLGLNATNEKWAGWDGLTRELYPLYQFNLKEWEIIGPND